MKVSNDNNYYIIAGAFVTVFASMTARTSTFIPRSQGDNTARELVGWQQQLFNSYKDTYAAVASTIEYTRSFKPERLACTLFNRSSLTFVGSQNRVRNEEDIVADYFGLSTRFRGTLALKPRIENVIIDLNFYVGFADWCPGLYMRVNSPIVHTRWTLGLDSCLSCADSSRGTKEFPECYMLSSQAGDPPGLDCPANTTLQLPTSAKHNCTAPDLRDALSGNFTFGDMTEPWNFGRFSFCPESKSGLADIDVSFGWNGLQNDCYHAGIFGVVVIPTGNRPKAKNIFEPIVGDGKHWHLGAGFSGHWSLYPTDQEGCFNSGIYIEARAVNVFKTDQMRSFDFKNNGFLSRYLLLKEFDLDGLYTGKLINAINFTTRNCEVSVGAQVDISAKVFMRYSGWEFDLGYNFFQRAREKICFKAQCPCPLDARIFGIKGVEGVCCLNYEAIEFTPSPIVQADTKKSVALNTTQNTTTIFTPNLPSAEPVLLPPEDPDGLQTTCLSWNGEQLTQNMPFSQLTVANDFIGADVTAIPETISCADLDVCSAAQGRKRTHKVFGHISYTFDDGCYCPHIGIGAEGEFDGCRKNTLEQWGIWFKAGLSF